MFFIAFSGVHRSILHELWKEKSSSWAKVHSMHLGPKISGVKLAFPSAWRRGYCLNYNPWCTGAIKGKSPRTVLLIFAPQVYANLQLWRTPEMLLAYLRREVYKECTLDHGCCKRYRPRLHCTGTTSAPEQKVLRFTCVYTAPVQKLYQIALPFTLYRSPLLIKSQYCYCALLKNKNTYHMS